MVTGTHPEDVDLFDYVEGDLPETRRAEIEAHFASCPQCAEQVAGVRAGRDALRTSQSLELPRSRRDLILLNLPARRKEGRSFGFSLKQVLAVVMPIATVAVVAAIVVALSTTAGNSDENAAVGGDAGTAESAATLPMTAAGAGETTEDNRAHKEALSAAGPAAAVAADLRQKGFDAVARNGHVRVRNATRAEVRSALRGRLDGSVRIVIVP
jgi:anti-sigma factor RsiW